MAGDVRYGIIGTGMMGVEHLRNLQALPGARVTAVADPHAGSLEAVVLAAGGPDQASFERLDDHRGLLDSGLCDAVVVATPNMTHCDVMLDVLARPVHVLVEKPLATTVADCRRIMAAAEAAPVSLDGRRRVVWVGLEYRYMPPVRRLAELVRAGAVGTVRMVAIREHRFPFLAKVGDWNRFTRNTGGTLVEKCCHFFDLMNHLTQRRPVQVFASGAQDVNHLDERYAGETPDVLDNAFVIVDYEGGMRASLDLCMFAEASRHQEEISVVGDLGKIEARLPGGQVHLGVRKRGRPGITTEVVGDERIAYEGFHHGSSYLEHVDFLEAVRSHQPPKVGLEDGLLSVAMGVAAHRSIDEGRPVEVRELLDEA